MRCAAKLQNSSSQQVSLTLSHKKVRWHRLFIARVKNEKYGSKALGNKTVKQQQVAVNFYKHHGSDFPLQENSLRFAIKVISVNL